MASLLGPRNLGDIIGETFGIYTRNFLKIIAIVAIVEVTLGVLGYVLENVFAQQPPSITGDWLESLVPFILEAIMMVGIIMVVSIIAYPLMEGAVIQAVSEQSLGQRISIGRAYRFAWRRFWTMLGAQLLAGLAILGMSITIIGIPFAIYFGIRWIFIWQAVMVEGAGVIGALSRSSEAVKGDWWRVLGIGIVITIIIMVISFVVGLIPVVGATIGAILYTPIIIIAATLLYYDLRVRKQGYSLETLATELNIKLDSSVA